MNYVAQYIIRHIRHEGENILRLNRVGSVVLCDVKRAIVAILFFVFLLPTSCFAFDIYKDGKNLIVFPTGSSYEEISAYDQNSVEVQPPTDISAYWTSLDGGVTYQMTGFFNFYPDTQSGALDCSYTYLGVFQSSCTDVVAFSPTAIELNLFKMDYTDPENPVNAFIAKYYITPDGWSDTPYVPIATTSSSTATSTPQTGDVPFLLGIFLVIAFYFFIKSIYEDKPLQT